MSSNVYDTIVCGLGGMGSATCHHLAKRGQRILGIEKFDVGHSMGSSHGVNRIIRLAYFEHSKYVPLLRRAYELWRETEASFGEQLLFITGSIDAGPEGSRIVDGSLASCAEHGLDHELLSAAQINARFPGYHLPLGHFGILQPEGGFVASERAIAAHLQLAMAAGADIRAREAFTDAEPTAEGGVRVRTEHGVYEASRLVITTGSWIEDHVPLLKGRAVPERQVLGWFAPRKPELFKLGNFPVSNTLTPHGHYYQFPQWGAPGFKIGLYHHLHETGHADALDRTPNARDEALLRVGLEHYFPEANGATLRLAACSFTNTPDEHFVIDTLPAMPQVIYASPCSGHGFKFSSVIGEILADLAEKGETRHDLSLFGAERLG